MSTSAPEASASAAAAAAAAGLNGALILADDLWRTYQMGAEEIHALRGVSFTIKPGEYVAVMGPSGSGKSTLMNLVSGIDQPSDGEVIVAGQSLGELVLIEAAHVLPVQYVAARCRRV